MRIANPSRRRRGISELVGTVLTVAITIITGSAVFGYVNGQAGVSESAYGQSSQNALQALQENFVPFNTVFTSNTVSVYFYNMGTTPFYPVQITIYDGAKALNVLYTPTQAVNLNNPAGCTVSPSYPSYLGQPLYNPAASSQPSNVYGLSQGAISYITLTLPCSLQFGASGTIYYMLVTGLRGNTVAFSQSK